MGIPIMMARMEGVIGSGGLVGLWDGFDSKLESKVWGKKSLKSSSRLTSYPRPATCQYHSCHSKLLMDDTAELAWTKLIIAA